MHACMDAGVEACMEGWTEHINNKWGKVLTIGEFG